MSINIIKATGTTNTDYYSRNLTRKYIVLHYTAGTKSTKGSARNVASMFKAGSVGGSADFIVDDSEIVQYNGDIKHRACWAVGGKKYTSVTTSEGAKYYGKCTNTNSISIEMCSNKADKDSLSAGDLDWYLTKATVNNAVELTKYLMKQYNIPVENVIMHHQVTGKICPNPWCVNSGRLSKWYNFKKRLTETKPTTPVETKKFEYITANVNDRECKFTGFNEKNENWVKATAILETLGYKAKWNAIKKRVIAVKDGKETLLDIRTYISADSISFCPLRELCEYLGYVVKWDSADKKISVTKK